MLVYFVIRTGKFLQSGFVGLIGERPYEKTEIGFLIVPGFEVPKLGLLFPAILNLLTAEQVRRTQIISGTKWRLLSAI